MDVYEKLKEILIELLDVEEDAIVPNAKLITDLKASSVDVVEILAAVENEFDVRISDEEAQEIRTVGAFADFIKARMG